MIFRLLQGSALAVVLAAVSSSAAGTLAVRVDNMAFVPAKLTAHVGDTVEWTNADFVVHSATSTDGQWDINLPVGKKGSAVLKKAGHIAYTCKYHPNMKAEIEVLP